MPLVFMQLNDLWRRSRTWRPALWHHPSDRRSPRLRTAPGPPAPSLAGRGKNDECGVRDRPDTSGTQMGSSIRLWRTSPSHRPNCEVACRSTPARCGRDIPVGLLRRIPGAILRALLCNPARENTALHHFEGPGMSLRCPQTDSPCCSPLQVRMKNDQKARSGPVSARSRRMHTSRQIRRRHRRRRWSMLGRNARGSRSASSWPGWDRCRPPWTHLHSVEATALDPSSATTRTRASDPSDPRAVVRDADSRQAAQGDRFLTCSDPGALRPGTTTAAMAAVTRLALLQPSGTSRRW